MDRDPHAPQGPLRLAIVGGGWAGLAAAVEAVDAGHAVTLIELSAQWGGRARGVEIEGLALDNGQHILIGAYRHTLALMARVGADPDALARRPLELLYPDGRGLRMPAAPAWLGFGLAVLRCRGWTLAERVALLRAATGWALAGFACDPAWTVARLCHALPPPVRELLIDPLCVAALNTPAAEASASVLLRVLRDALFGGAGAADLLLPRRSLAALLPEPAACWLQKAGARLQTGRRVQALAREGAGWRVDGEAFDAVVLACSAAESARLVEPLTPTWAAQAQALRYEPIVTVYMRCPGARLPSPMTALLQGPRAPAQFAFDHGALGGAAGVFAFVVSGARPWVEAGLAATGAAVLEQAATSFAPGTWPQPPTVLRVLAEKRATFRCTPGLDRPAATIAPGLVAAGDYIAGPYPATLEGAVRSGEQAVAALRSTLTHAIHDALTDERTAPPAARR
ncbi:Phytoene desaturase, pro-zeta-carotene producing [Rubrivivax sp. A210]|uniref:hydroxysqualene dehydroxylase HpnE n=1 Tax=Rubrivivax sp. A210 TaxID=2772301 RepID=UPI0019B650B1|nr:hydroxysqualene dehydroxylase HpnE [Rubrivivax sp. A210]CAD5374708.1 Phytoene desaturase, pro-zeta-carotene producing [Rubrivivax sp. A210]